MRNIALCLSLVVLVCPLSSYADSLVRGPSGQAKTVKTRSMEMGAKAVQTNAPPNQLTLHLAGLHPMKDNPSRQLVAHHFCKQVNEDFAQCVLFDSNTRDANLNGIEYIISEKLYHELPENEKAYWHPHQYEVLSGTLVAPRIPNAVEKRMMREKLTTYGKTWHVWNTGHFGMNDGQKLPMGDPMLGWSFNHDGEMQPGLLDEFQKKLKVNVQKIRESRKELDPTRDTRR